MSTPPALHKAILCVDIERFSDPQHEARDQLKMRKGLYESLTRASVESEIPWDECYHEDRGDGAFFLVHSHVPQARLVEPLPFELAAELGRHNQAHPGNRIRLRVAMDAGYVRQDAEGVVGPTVIRAFRLLDAPVLREALRDAPGALAFITSAEFYDEVIRQRRGFDPSGYRQVRATVKETDVDAWIWTSDVQLRAGQRYGEGVARIEAAIASIDDELANAREERAVTVGKIAAPVPDVPELAPRLRERLAALDGPRREHRWDDVIADVTELELAANASLLEARAVRRAVRAPLDRREELRGLLQSYQAMAHGYGRAEDLRLDELYRQARELLWTAPCDLSAAETATTRYVRAIQEESGS